MEAKHSEHPLDLGLMLEGPADRLNAVREEIADGLKRLQALAEAAECSLRRSPGSTRGGDVIEARLSPDVDRAARAELLSQLLHVDASLVNAALASGGREDWRKVEQASEVVRQRHSEVAVRT